MMDAILSLASPRNCRCGSKAGFCQKNIENKTVAKMKPQNVRNFQILRKYVDVSKTKRLVMAEHTKPLRAIQFYLVIIVKILFRAYLPFKGEKNAIKKMPTKLQVVQVVLPAAL